MDETGWRRRPRQRRADEPCVRYGSWSAAPAPVANPLYSQSVISLGPAGYWRLGDSFGATALDSSGNQSAGGYHGSPAFGEPGAIQGDANTAIGLNGASYVEIPSRGAFSIGATGLTVQAWLRPDRLSFPCQANTEYIHWLGKGEVGTYEWGFRFYKKDSSRPNRVSAYIWNPDGKLGAGAYFQEPVAPASGSKSWRCTNHLATTPASSSIGTAC